MRILVMGAGAMGSVVGGFMAEAGHDVVLVGRTAHMSAIDRDGLCITGIWGEHRIGNLRTATSVEDIGGEAYDLVIIAVKSYDTSEAAQAVAPFLRDDTLVLAYQNGLGNAEKIAAVAGWRRTVGVRAIYGVWVPEPGRAEVTVIAEPTALGVFTQDAPVARVRETAEAMNAAGLPTAFSDEIETTIWAKVAYNCALNPLSALLDVPYGTLVEMDSTLRIMEDVVRELYAVGHAMGVRLMPETPEDYFRFFVEKLVPPTAAHYASMREDLRRGRRTEIDALNGAVHQFGIQHEVPCPSNALLARLIHARERLLDVR